MPLDNKSGAKDLFNTIKKSPALMITVAVGGGLLIWMLINRNNSNGGATTTPVDGTSLAATTNPGGYYVPSSPSTQPIILVTNPSGVTPSPTPPTTTPIPMPPVQLPQVPTGSGGATIPSTEGTHPIIPYDFFKSHQFPVQPNNKYANVKTFTYAGTTYNITPGAGGRVWGTANGKTQLLYAPRNYY